VRLEIEAPGCRSSVRRSTEPQAGHENDSQGTPATIAAPMSRVEPLPPARCLPATPEMNFIPHEARPVCAALPHKGGGRRFWVISLAYGIAVMAIASALAFIIWSVERFAKRGVRRHHWRAMHTWLGWRK
jgi:hypothetical protein